MSETMPNGIAEDDRRLRGRAVLIEGARGGARGAALAARLHAARGAGSDAFLVSCRLDTGGPWAGLNDLLRALVPQIDAVAPDLVVRHRYELSMAVPELRRRFPLKDASLTDGSAVKERVRSYPTDRAYRLLHGLIDFLAAFLSRPDARPLVVACDDFDASGALMRRFFRELIRRRLTRLPLELLFVVQDGQGDALTGDLGGGLERVRLDVPGEEEMVDAGAAAREADALEARVEAHLGGHEDELPRLIDCCLRSGQRLRAQRWRSAALAVYNHFGLYEDALFFGEPLIPDLDEVSAQHRALSRWHVVSGLFNAYAALGRAEEAHRLVRDEALTKVTDPKDLVSVYYTMAMLHCRFLPQKDLALAERYLNASIATLDTADFAEAERHYLTVFNLNGLAFIRHLQGRAEEAMELCRAGYERLEEHLRQDQHRLHRSVLLYNIAQVHMSMRRYEEAVESYTAAMAMDPRYSEYYNERGGAYLKLGRLDEAIADLRTAIELSAPYHEVWTNLGQAQKAAGRFAEAVAAYSAAIDIDPSQVLPWLGRAQAHEGEGRLDAALADYGAALALDSANAEVWSNRGSLNFECGRLAEACADLDEAVRRAPGTADLYWNRGAVRERLGRAAEAASDYATYLRLAADAPDRDEAQARLEALRAAAGAPARA